MLFVNANKQYILRITTAKLANFFKIGCSVQDRALFPHYSFYLNSQGAVRRMHTSKLIHIILPMLTKFLALHR